MKKLPVSSWITRIIPALLLLAGFGLRLIDLTDQPLDFHPYRQLHAAIIARGMYAQMLTAWEKAPTGLQSSEWAGLSPANIDPVKAQSAVNMWHRMEVFEPQILERLVAMTYWLAGAEVLWLSRVYTTLFWVFGGLALFMLARRATSYEGGLLALAFYLFLPFGVTASRSFQPDPVMVSLVLWSAYAAYRWSENPTWRWAILTGILSGLAVLIKAPAACQIGFLLVFTVLGTWKLNKAIRQPQVWAVAAISVLIPTTYYLLQRGAQSSGYMQFWSASFARMILEPSFYIRWLNFLNENILDIGWFFIGLASTALFSSRGKAIALGLWVGYGVNGLLLPSLIVSHNYYSLSLVPTVAFSLAPLAAPIRQFLTSQHKAWQITFYTVIVIALAYSAWNSRVTLAANDYNTESLSWQAIARELPTDGHIIAISHDYGTRLGYYGWVMLNRWPTAAELNLTSRLSSDLDEFASMFASMTQGYDFFLVTLTGELDAQPLLSERLYNNYPLLVDGPDYLLFDLTP